MSTIEGKIEAATALLADELGMEKIPENWLKVVSSEKLIENEVNILLIFAPPPSAKKHKKALMFKFGKNLTDLVVKEWQIH